MRPARTTAADAGAQPGDHVGGDQHALDRDAHLAARPSGRRRRHRSSGPRPSPWPSQARARPPPRTTKKEFGTPKVSEPPSASIQSGMPRIVVWPIASWSAEPRQMLSVASVMMKGCGRRPIDVDEAVDGADQRAGAAASRGHERRGIDDPKHEPADRRSPAPGWRRPKVDPARQDDECWPIATMAMTAVWARMLPILPGFRKLGVSRPITAISSDQDQQRPEG